MLPRYNIPRMPVSPIPPITPRPHKRKASNPVRFPVEDFQPQAKRPALRERETTATTSNGRDLEREHLMLQETLPLTASQISGRAETSGMDTPPIIEIDDTPPADASFGDGSSNEAGTKSKDYTPSPQGDPHALPPSPPPPGSPSPPDTPPSKSPSELSSADSKDDVPRVFFNTENALIANASLSHAPPSSTSDIPEHVLIQVETENPQGQIVQEITHILHFHTAHDSSAILRAFQDNAINVELPDEGIHDSLQVSQNTTWRPQAPPASPEPGPSSTNATYGSPEPITREPSWVEPSIDFDALHLSSQQNPGLADADEDIEEAPLINLRGEEGRKEEGRGKEGGSRK